MSVYRVIRGSQQASCGPIECLSKIPVIAAHLAHAIRLENTNIMLIKYQRNSITTTVMVFTHGKHIGAAAAEHTMLACCFDRRSALSACSRVELFTSAVLLSTRFRSACHVRSASSHHCTCSRLCACICASASCTLRHARFASSSHLDRSASANKTSQNKHLNVVKCLYNTQTTI